MQTTLRCPIVSIIFVVLGLSLQTRCCQAVGCTRSENGEVNAKVYKGEVDHHIVNFIIFSPFTRPLGTLYTHP